VARAPGVIGVAELRLIAFATQFVRSSSVLVQEDRAGEKNFHYLTKLSHPNRSILLSATLETEMSKHDG
jgi:hypothetical protein